VRRFDAQGRCGATASAARLGGAADAGHKPAVCLAGQGRAMSNFNAIAGAVLASVLGVMAVSTLANSVVQSHFPETAGYLPEVAPETPSGSEAPAGPPDFGRLFADPARLQELVARGERVMAQCRSCHTFEAGGAEGIGPNLHDVFGRVAASHGGYDYSNPMDAHDVTWGYLELNDYLRSPGTVVRGTKMAFAGLRNEEDRVAMIAYLRSISPNNVPLPAPLPEPAAAEAPAEGAAPQGAAAPPAAPAQSPGH
jgi:cytochrome c